MSVLYVQNRTDFSLRTLYCLCEYCHFISYCTEGLVPDQILTGQYCASRIRPVRGSGNEGINAGSMDAVVSTTDSIAPTANLG
jgi:hypothetical protein